MMHNIELWCSDKMRPHCFFKPDRGLEKVALMLTRGSLTSFFHEGVEMVSKKVITGGVTRRNTNVTKIDKDHTYFVVLIYMHILASIRI